VSDVNESRNELDWLAFCFLSGEMSPAEAERFEARLEGEQEAREALARAVELTQVVAAVEATCEASTPSLARRVSVRSAGNWTTRLSWMAIGGLASLVIAMVWTGGLSRFSFGPQNAGISSENGALATAWSATRAVLQETVDVGPLHPLSAANGEVDDDQVASGELTDELVVVEAPSWMTVAIEGLASEMDQDEPGSDEPLVN
jgi:hypothetical protein